jgi:hypothetical protein
MNSMRHTTLLTLLTLFSFCLVGCSATSAFKTPDFSAWKPAGPAAKTIAAWEPAIKHNGDKPAERGFGGRVYFYDASERKPIKVKGNVVVYAYDEEGRKVDDNVPTVSFAFDQKDLDRNYSKSKLGHSYNLWIPWDSQGADGKAKKVTLIVRYIPDKGSSVLSSQVAVHLPGKMDEKMMLAGQPTALGIDANGIQQVGYRVSATMPQDASIDPHSPKPEERMIEANENRPQTMHTATISIPNGK